LAKIGENVKIKLLKIAVTGEVASGKSTVCKYFKQLGAFVVDSDKIVHDLLTPKTSVGQKIIKFLGKEILEKDEISREKVAAKVFQDFKKLKKLEAIIHPQVFEAIERLYQLAAKEGVFIYFVVEIPLLFEAGLEKFYDYIIVVTAKNRSKRSPKKDLREKRLIDIHEKTEKADFVINNNSNFTMLKRQVIKISNILTKIIKENSFT
jgi:dephospho-CoA kinase